MSEAAETLILRWLLAEARWYAEAFHEAYEQEYGRSRDYDPAYHLAWDEGADPQVTAAAIIERNDWGVD